MKNIHVLEPSKNGIGLRSSRVQGRGSSQGLGSFQDGSQRFNLGYSVVDMVRLGSKAGSWQPVSKSERHEVSETQCDLHTDGDLHTERHREPPQVRPPGKAAGQRQANATETLTRVLPYTRFQKERSAPRHLLPQNPQPASCAVKSTQEPGCYWVKERVPQNCKITAYSFNSVIKCAKQTSALQLFLNCVNRELLYYFRHLVTYHSIQFQTFWITQKQILDIPPPTPPPTPPPRPPPHVQHKKQTLNSCTEAVLFELITRGKI